MRNKAELLLEIGCEEIPSRFMAPALEQLREEASTLLAENRLEHGKIETMGTPRRLVLHVHDLAPGQPDLEETVKGPPVNRAYDEQGNPTRALTGFMQSQNVGPGQVAQEEIKGARYVVVRREIPGRATAELLPELLPLVIRKLGFPRPMYWQNKEIRFARPIRWLLALYADEPVKFSYAGIESGRQSYGHRFLAPGPFSADSPGQYFRRLEEHKVVLSQDRRREMIREQLEQKAAERGGRVAVDEGLLEEVVYLVEYPVAVDGSFDPAHLDLPREVLVTTMQHHQRYFSVEERDSSKLLPCFVGISNNLFHDNIRKGYSKVLQARLADARFFFNEDRKKPLHEYVEQLTGVVFLEPLGSLEQKRARLVKLTGRLGLILALPPDLVEKAERVAHLCKADLVTGMVKEFTDLQGVMGREYALLSGEPEEVATGLYEHYLPRFSGDSVPSALEGALVSLADRIDTLAGCFAIGIQPTGSQDPYALRRQAQGAVAIMLGLGIDLPLKRYVSAALDVLGQTLDIPPDKRGLLEENLHDFLVQRVRFALQEKSISHEVVEAVLAVPFGTLSVLFERAGVIEEYLKGPLLDDVIVAYNRVANLAKNAAGGSIDASLFESAAERELFACLKKAEEALAGIDNPARCLEELQLLKEPIDYFFDQVMVMVEDDRLRSNRLNLLAALKTLFNGQADFSRLQAP